MSDAPKPGMPVPRPPAAQRMQAEAIQAGEYSEALRGRLDEVGELPLAQRSAALAALHEELSSRLHHAED